MASNHGNHKPLAKSEESCDALLGGTTTRKEILGKVREVDRIELLTVLNQACAKARQSQSGIELDSFLSFLNRKGYKIVKEI